MALKASLTHVDFQSHLRRVVQVLKGVLAKKSPPSVVHSLALAG